MLQDIKKTLWATADKLRANVDAAEYKHIVLGLIFLKFISDSFAGRRAELLKRLKDPSSKALMTVIDTINSKAGSKVWFASQGISQAWTMKRAMLSPQYTTKWTDLPVVK